MYAKGHIKRNNVTGESATRTSFAEDQGPALAGLAWLIAHPDDGMRHGPTSEVADWDDMWTPPESAE